MLRIGTDHLVLFQVCVCVWGGGGGGGGESRKTCIKRIFARTIQAKK